MRIVSLCPSLTELVFALGLGRDLLACKKFGVHPEEGHDIPGVRSLRQLHQTELFRPDEYDELVEVANQEAFELCLRLNREEAIIAGPSSAMALAGAFKLVPDEPGLVVVVLFSVLKCFLSNLFNITILLRGPQF